MRFAVQPAAALPLQSAKPGVQVKLHVVPLHVAVEFGPLGHGVQSIPHVAGSVSLAHTAPQAWKPPLQVKPHWMPLHVAAAFGGGAQGVHDAPHVEGSLSLAHPAPQAW